MDTGSRRDRKIIRSSRTWARLIFANRKRNNINNARKVKYSISHCTLSFVLPYLLRKDDNRESTCKRNIETRSHNHCWLRKPIRWVCVLTLVIQHARRLNHTVFCGLSGTTYFSTVFHRPMGGGSLSPRHGASSGCGWSKGLRYGG